PDVLHSTLPNSTSTHQAGINHGMLVFRGGGAYGKLFALIIYDHSRQDTWIHSPLSNGYWAITVKHSFVRETNFLPTLKLFAVETERLKKQMRGHVIYRPAVFCHRTAAASLSLPPSAMHSWSAISVETET
ncbi:hypothetical protein J6590_105994, partial [Homalodisca vitripennis]